jgi:hypothetical protein
MPVSEHEGAGGLVESMQRVAGADMSESCAGLNPLDKLQPLYLF